MDEDISEELDSEEQIDEALKPEVSTKAKEIFKTMIGDRRDKLMKRYGANAEKVAYGRAIAQAKKQLEKHNIPIIKDMPGVGKNLNDHPIVWITYKTKKDFKLKVIRPVIICVFNKNNTKERFIRIPMSFGAPKNA